MRSVRLKRNRREISWVPIARKTALLAVLLVFAGLGGGWRAAKMAIPRRRRRLLPASAKQGLPDAPAPATAQMTNGSSQVDKTGCNKLPCPAPLINWYMRFENGPQVKPLTPREKAWLATKNVVDPFNAITILGISGISVASDSHSAYGPGMPGFGRYVGVSLQRTSRVSSSAPF
jgi:hypothetical protein